MNQEPVNISTTVDQKSFAKTPLEFAEQLPRLASWTVRALPAPLLRTSLQTGLNHVFKQELKKGNLDFIRGRTISIIVPDIQLAFALRLERGRLQVSMAIKKSDVRFSANLMSLLKIMAGETDPDTLFFKRQLSLTGDTELGLSIKNFLDSLELETLVPTPIHRTLRYIVGREKS